MAKTLQRKFIFAAMTAVTILLLTLVGAINILNRIQTADRQGRLLEMLCEADGQPEKHMRDPEFRGQDRRRTDWPGPESAPEDVQQEGETSQSGRTGTDRGPGSLSGRGERRFSMDEMLSARYFAVRLDEEGGVLETDVSRIYAVTEEEAASLGQSFFQAAKKSGREGGTAEGFRYLCKEQEDGEHLLIAMDISGDSRDLLTVLGISVMIAALCWIAMLLPVYLLTRRAIAPTAVSIERQKQFVTNAGHELKTPLAIIQANTEALELYNGESKWTRNIRTQTMRLSDLMQNLLTLARMDENALVLQKQDFALDILAGEVWENFIQPAEARGLSWSIPEPGTVTARVHGNRESLAQLLSILFDNAVKYTPEGGRIEVRFSSGAGMVVLEQSNTIVSSAEDGGGIPEDPDRLFERFYRTDADRSRKKGGFGIGLSAAKAIAEANGGRIRARTGDGRLAFLVSLQPARGRSGPDSGPAGERE